MKKVFTIFLLVSALFSCRKESPVRDLRSEIIGTWELRQSICGFCFIPFTTYPPGNGNIIAISSNGIFERKKRDTLLFRGNYILSKDKQCNKTLGDIAFSSNDSINPIWYVTIKSDTLALSTPYCDPQRSR